MKTGINVFRFCYPVITLCVMLVFGMMLSGCNESDDNDINPSETVETTVWYMDADGDGYGDAGVSMQAATQPSGYVSDNTDCDDNNADIHPAATEICGDGTDQDCDETDPACATEMYYKDTDKDGYSDGTTLESTEQPAGYYESAELTSTWGDCDDTNAKVNPEAVEICNDGTDNDCNGDIDCNDIACADDIACGIDDTSQNTLPYPIVDTGQTSCYDNSGKITSPQSGEAFHGQDAQYTGNASSYTNNGDGTVTDNNTGLMWQQDPGDKMTYDEAVSSAASFDLADYEDWRLPTVKELYSLMLFSGMDPSGLEGNDTSGLIPFIDTDYFDFEYGDPTAGERIIDSQWATSTQYVNTTMDGNATMFGVNFADGRIKGYPIENKTYFVIYVRGNTDYGVNDFVDDGDGTVTDNATGLMWMQQDSGYFAAGDDNDGALNWEQALEWAETLEYAGYADWRLPNAKELQSIVDYTRSPVTSNSAAIDPVFSTSVIIDEGGNTNYPFYWNSTTHANMHNGANAIYVAFGEALGWMQSPFGDYTLMDVHGAGAQRSDPKIGDPANYPYDHGPQGDVIRIYNYVRCVRDADMDTEQSQDDDSDDVFDGYMLLAPLQSYATYLVDTDESVAHTWTSKYTPGNSAYLLEDGTLLRTGKVSNGNRFVNTGGVGGIVEKLDWNSNVTWRFEYATDDSCLHHDVEELPNGNILMIAWEYKTSAEAEAAGRNSNLLADDELWPDKIIEVNPGTNDIVWAWYGWDHLIQDHDATKVNYGTVSDHPELIDINYVDNPRGKADWNHMNSADYNEALDQIIVSVHGFNEFWVIDHSTTTTEAASHSGGIYDKGGDILYRWGNSAAYGATGVQEFYGQHDAHWIPPGLPGAGNILVFNNGQGRPEGNYSTVEEIVPDIKPDGSYPITVGQSFGPSSSEWIYTAPTPTNFYGQNISGAQRLPNGNTLICEGPDGYIFEITPDGSVVWTYQNTDGMPVFRAYKYPYDYSGLLQL